MKAIVAPRGSGKTTQLIKLCAAHQYALIVCRDRHMCEWTYRHAQELGYNIPLPITFQEFLSGVYRGKLIDALLFDNIDLSLQSLTNVPIEAITLTGENE